ncbi:MAG: pentapeptide repeat-containing protein [Micrococcaceae bacterium]
MENNQQERFALFLDKKLAAYSNIPGIEDLKEELLTHLMDKYHDLRENGITEELAYLDSVEEFKDLDDMIEELLPEAQKYQGSSSLHDNTHKNSFGYRDTRRKSKHHDKMSDWEAEFTGDPTHRVDYEDTKYSTPPTSSMNEGSQVSGGFGFPSGFQGFVAPGQSSSMHQGAHNATHDGYRHGNQQNLGFTLGSILKDFVNNVSSEFGMGEGSPQKTLIAKDMKNTDFTNVNLSSYSFNMCDIKSASFSDASLSDSRFRATDLKKSNYLRVAIDNVRVMASDMKHSYMQDVSISNASFTGTDIKKATILDSKIEQAQFNGCDLGKTVFKNVSISSTVFNSTSLKSATFEQVNLTNVTFQNSDVRRTYFTFCAMSQAIYDYLNSAGAALDNIKIV